MFQERIRERFEARRRHSPKARALGRLAVWLNHEVLLGGLPIGARRLGLLLIFGTLAVEIPWILSFVADPFTVVFWVGVALTVGALFLDSRMLTLRSYGFSTDMIGGSVQLLALLLIGPAFVPVYVAIYICARTITRPQQPLYRHLVTGQIYFLMGTVACAWLMLWPDWHQLGTLGLLVMAVMANMLMSVVSVLLVNTMIARSAGEALKWRASTLEVASFWPSDLPAGALVVLAVQAYVAWGAIGVLLIAAAIFAPVMLLLAPDVDNAWRSISAATTTQFRQARSRELLEEKLVSESELAYTDPVTGLGNRYRFERDLSAIGRESRPMVLIIGDIAGLKAVNDQRGHDVGDELIRAGATGLRRALRANDKIYRFGGDEFAALIPVSDVAEMEKILGRINNEVRQVLASSPALRGVRSWMRLGWASSQEGIGDLYSRADSHLLVRREQERLLGMAIHA